MRYGHWWLSNILWAPRQVLLRYVVLYRSNAFPRGEGFVSNILLLLFTVRSNGNTPEGIVLWGLPVFPIVFLSEM